MCGDTTAINTIRAATFLGQQETSFTSKPLVLIGVIVLVYHMQFKYMPQKIRGCDDTPGEV